MSKKSLFSTLILTIVGCLSGYPVFADKLLGNYGNDTLNLATIISNIETGVWVIFFAIVVICFVISGVLFLTAQGEPDKLKTARASFIWGIVGIVVGIVAYSILIIIAQVLTGHING